MTGASGTAVAVDFLKRCPGEKYLIISNWGKSVLHQETGLTLNDISLLATQVFSNEDLNAPFASGSVQFDNYVVLPCSLATLGRIATGIGENLISRIAEVALKERRPMLLGIRETPMSAIALENALKLSRLGVTIMPLSPAFYFKKNSPEEMIHDSQAGGEGKHSAEDDPLEVALAGRDGELNAREVRQVATEISTNTLIASAVEVLIETDTRINTLKAQLAMSSGDQKAEIEAELDKLNKLITGQMGALQDQIMGVVRTIDADAGLRLQNAPYSLIAVTQELLSRGRSRINLEQRKV
jgi:4-hydroxy-3-polyprenylbenzoate decarboxylase